MIPNLNNSLEIKQLIQMKGYHIGQIYLRFHPLYISDPLMDVLFT